AGRRTSAVIAGNGNLAVRGRDELVRSLAGRHRRQHGARLGIDDGEGGVFLIQHEESRPARLRGTMHDRDGERGEDESGDPFHGPHYMIPVPMPSELQHDLRGALRELCQAFPDAYWRELDQARAYPDAFVQALTDAGYLAALIPEEYGGAGLGVLEASIILEEINRSGGNAGACHAQMYTMGTLLRHGSEAQKRTFLPPIAAGGLRLQGFRVTEPTARS